MRASYHREPTTGNRPPGTDQRPLTGALRHGVGAPQAADAVKATRSKQGSNLRTLRLSGASSRSPGVARRRPKQRRPVGRGGECAPAPTWPEGPKEGSRRPACHGSPDGQPAYGQKLRHSTVSAAVEPRFRVNGGQPRPGARSALEVVRRASPHRAHGAGPVRMGCQDLPQATMRRAPVVVKNVRLAVASGPGFRCRTPILRRGGLRCSGARHRHSGRCRTALRDPMLAKVATPGTALPGDLLRSPVARLGTRSLDDAIPLLAATCS